MRLRFPFDNSRLSGVLASLGTTVGILLFICIIYFYIYLPNVTNHGESVVVPDLKGMKIEELESFLRKHDLRYQVDDSSYSEELPPLSVLLQFPRAGHQVKQNRIIYVTVNQVAPPTVPLPDLVDRSRINAEVVLKSNELKRGKVYFVPSPFLNLVKEMRYNGKLIEAGVRIPKGATIDLLVGDGNGPVDYMVGNVVGDTYKRALVKLAAWNLHVGQIEIPEGVDTTGIEPVVYKQYPAYGDPVRVGDPIDIWLAPRGYKEPEDNEDNEN
jgi:eukaryotic-like serine/threonine-protein kinase